MCVCTFTIEFYIMQIIIALVELGLTISEEN